jgi:pyridoxamine 5'-phosphate oxidase
MRDPDVSHYNNLTDAFAESWRLATRGVADRRSGFHHATVSSIGLEGQPRLRTVILRGCEPAAWALRFHTDRRSTKIAELERDPRMSVLLYDTQAKIQLRFEGLASLHHDDDVADKAWEQTRVFSRQCYGILPGPGTMIDEGASYFLPETTSEATASGREHFCAVVVKASSFEWLYLASGGHRRASFVRTSDGFTSQWLAP